MSDREFTLSQAMAAQKLLRSHLGLPEERFPVPALVGMLSDEIEQLRDRGIGDAEAAKLIQSATGVAVTAEEITQFYAPPEDRQRGQAD